MPPRIIPVIVSYRGISEIAGPAAIFLIRSILTLGKAIAAKYIFYATGAVLTVPNIQLIAEKRSLYENIRSRVKHLQSH